MWTWLDMSPNWCEWQQDARGKVMQFNLCLNSARTFFYPVSCCTKSGLMCALCVPRGAAAVVCGRFHGLAVQVGRGREAMCSPRDAL